MRRTLVLLLLAAGIAFAQDRLPMQDDLWREFDLYRTRLLDLARSIPEDKFDFRPAPDVRSIKEIVLHVGLNNYMLFRAVRQKGSHVFFRHPNGRTTTAPTIQAEIYPVRSSVKS